MIRPFARRVVQTLPTLPARHYATAGLVTVIGIAISVIIWQSAETDHRTKLASLLGTLADRSASALEQSIDREVDGLRSLSTRLQTNNPASDKPWQFEAGMVLDHFTGVRWIAWVKSDSTKLDFVGRDSKVRMDGQIMTQSRIQLKSNATAWKESWAGAYELVAFLPVRSSTKDPSVLVGGIRIDSLWMNSQPRLSGLHTVRLFASDRDMAVLRKVPDSFAPGWMHNMRTLHSPSGSTLNVEFIPSDQFVRQLTTPWPYLFLFAGTLLSIALGTLLLSFLSLRDYSTALQSANRVLDARLAELSARDRELRDMNTELSARVQLHTAELSVALRELETFNHSVSHDLRSPLGAILNFAAVLEEDFGSQIDAQGRRFLERIRSAAGRANQLLDSLAEFTARETAAESPQVLDMKELAERAFAEAAGRDGRSTDVDFTVDALPQALGDPVLVHRVFVNLIGNALKFSRGRDARVLQVTGQAEPTESIYAVRDNGSGFDPTRATLIFEPFRRLHDTDIEGSGLGLAIVAKIISRHGGRVWAESDGATGAAFYFTLPRAEGRSNGDSGNPTR